MIDVPGVPRFEVAPHHCFACGTLNTSGHEPRPARRAAAAAGPSSTSSDRFEGWDGIAHGGILATILDEVMAWSLVGEDNWGLTARMNVEFKRPVAIGQPIRAEGWITRSRRRIVDTAAQLVDARAGPILATATGVYVAADEARKHELRERYDTFRSTIRPSPVDHDPMTIGDDRRRPPEPPRRDAPSRSSPPARPAAEALGTRPRRPRRATPTPSPRPSERGLERPRRPGVPRGPCSSSPRASAPIHGVRRPLLAAVARGFRHATRRDRPSPLLFIADRLFREPHLEARWFAFGLLERTLAADPERTWQLLRRAAREAADWITVDDLAHPYGIGIAAEPYRWAELEQLVYSPSRWERRLSARRSRR